jgi:hypothetical protein
VEEKERALDDVINRNRPLECAADAAFDTADWHREKLRRQLLPFMADSEDRMPLGMMIKDKTPGVGDKVWRDEKVQDVSKPCVAAGMGQHHVQSDVVSTALQLLYQQPPTLSFICTNRDRFNR